jgi:transposase-like protein
MFIRSIMRSMKQSQQEVLDMPYCQKCESNRHVVVNAGQSPDEAERWYCTHCREGF